MPTGYTEKVQSGEITTLHDFALRCARAFGATMEMRDAPLDTPIPERFEPVSYHKDRIKEAEERQAWLGGLSKEQAEQEAANEYEKEVARRKAYLERVALEGSRYRDMLSQIQDWQPPEDFAKLKNFMKEQITSSLEFDCTVYSQEKIKPLTGDEWLIKEMESVQHDIQYHTKEHAKEVERAEKNNRWLADLRASLPGKGDD